MLYIISCMLCSMFDACHLIYIVYDTFHIFLPIVGEIAGWVVYPEGPDMIKQFGLEDHMYFMFFEF